MSSNSILFSIALALLCIVSLSHGEEWEGRLALEPNGNDWIEGASLVLKPNSKTHKFPEHAALQVSSTIFNATSSKSLSFSVENQQIATLGKTAIDSPKGSVDSSDLEHDDHTFAYELSPCHFTGTQLSKISVATFFKVNSSVDLSLDFSANFVATRKVSDKPIEVPQQQIEYFTYVLPKQAEKGIIRLEDDKEEDEKYDLSIFLKPINDSDNKAKEVFVKLTVGCTSPKSFDLANVDWPIKIEGVTDTTYITLEAKETVEMNSFQFSITAKKADDDSGGLKGWEIALIVLGGIVGLIVVVGPFLGYLWRSHLRRGDYDRLAEKEVTGL